MPARTQVEQTLKEELDKMTQVFTDEIQTLKGRLKSLEQSEDNQTSSDSSAQSGKRSNDSDELSPEKRRKIFDQMYRIQFLQRNEQGHLYFPEHKRPYMPLCRGCQHAVPLDGEIMQYQSDEIQPRYSYSGFVACSKLGQMPLRSGPKMHCGLMKPDGGDQIDTSKRTAPEPF